MVTFDNTDYYGLITEKCKEYYGAKSMKSPLKMANEIMGIEGFPMHSPHHHYIVPAVLLTAAAIRKGTDEEKLDQMLRIAEKRARVIPGAVCGEMGACGAGIGAGIFSSVWMGTTPYSREHLGFVGTFTVNSLNSICQYSGPRCCKRVTFLALESACKDAAQMDLDLCEGKKIGCRFSKHNKDCIKDDCRFYR